MARVQNGLRFNFFSGCTVLHTPINKWRTFMDHEKIEGACINGRHPWSYVGQVDDIKSPPG